MSGPARPTELPAGLEARRVETDVDTEALEAIDKKLLGFPRSHAQVGQLLENREAYVFRRGGEAIGFAFVGAFGAGPLGARDPADLPAILLHVEGRTHALGSDELELQVPGPAGIAMRHLLSRGYRISPFANYLLSDRPFGQFDRFLGYNPPLFL